MLPLSQTRGCITKALFGPPRAKVSVLTQEELDRIDGKIGPKTPPYDCHPWMDDERMEEIELTREFLRMLDASAHSPPPMMTDAPLISPKDLEYFNTYILVRHPEALPPEELGFKDMRLGVLAPDKLKHQIWDYYGNHGCFMDDPFGEKTPFDRFYHVFRGTHMPPLLAYRLRRDVVKKGPCYDGKGSRVFDSMEMLDWNCQGGDLTLVQLINEEFQPETDMTVPEAFFIQQFMEAKRWV